MNPPANAGDTGLQDTIEACRPIACAPQQEKPPQREAQSLQIDTLYSLQLEKA